MENGVYFRIFLFHIHPFRFLRCFYSIKIENVKIKESSSRPLEEEKTEPDKNEESDETPRVYTTSEQMVNNKNDNGK